MINLLVGIILFLLIAASYLLIKLLEIRSLCEQLTESLKKLYCEEPGCEFLKYHDTPVDGKKGFITKHCSIHLMEHAENQSAGD